jgi:predicted heme/steroid binding protein
MLPSTKSPIFEHRRKIIPNRIIKTIKASPNREAFIYNSFMSIPDRIVTEMELRRNMGERGSRKFIAYNGIVYDVTDCPKWRLDMHENLHFPGQDLTSELPDAPHAEEVFTRPCIKIVGKLQTQ